MLKFEGTKIEMTELAFALEEVVVQQYQLTGYLDIDAKNVPINNAYRYSISGLNTGYEAKKGNPELSLKYWVPFLIQLIFFTTSLETSQTRCVSCVK